MVFTDNFLLFEILKLIYAFIFYCIIQHFFIKRLNILFGIIVDLT